MRTPLRSSGARPESRAFGEVISCPAHIPAQSREIDHWLDQDDARSHPKKESSGLQMPVLTRRRERLPSRVGSPAVRRNGADPARRARRLVLAHQRDVAAPFALEDGVILKR